MPLRIYRKCDRFFFDVADKRDILRDIESDV